MSQEKEALKKIREELDKHVETTANESGAEDKKEKDSAQVTVMNIIEILTEMGF